MKKLLPLVITLLLLPLALSAQTGTWTSVGSTGVLDETSAPHAFGPTSLTYAPGVAAITPIIARYNVTNTYGGGVSDLPPWSFLELGFQGTGGGGNVTASLYQVNRCTGARTLLCSVNSGGAVGPACNTCTFTPQINFGTSLYYVEVVLTRMSSNLFPQLNTLRVF